MHTQLRARFLPVPIVALLVAMCLSVALPSRSARADAANVGSITLTLKNRSNDIALRSGVISLYRVATVDRSGAGPRYDVSGGQFAGCDAVAGIADLDQEELDAQNESLTNELVRYIIDNDIDPIFSCVVTGTAEVRFTELEEGLYLVRQTKLSQDRLTMNPFLMSVPLDGQMDVVAYPKPGNDKGDSIIPVEEDEPEPGKPDPENPENPDDPVNPTDEPENPDNPDDPTNPTDEPENPDNPVNPTDEPENPTNPDNPNGDGTTPSNPGTTTTDGDNVTRVSGSTIVGSRTSTPQSGSTLGGGHVAQTGDASTPVGAVAAIGIAGLLVAGGGVALLRRSDARA